MTPCAPEEYGCQISFAFFPPFAHSCLLEAMQEEAGYSLFLVHGFLYSSLFLFVLFVDVLLHRDWFIGTGCSCSVLFPFPHPFLILVVSRFPYAFPISTSTVWILTAIRGRTASLEDSIAISASLGIGLGIGLVLGSRLRAWFLQGLPRLVSENIDPGVFRTSTRSSKRAVLPRVAMTTAGCLGDQFMCDKPINKIKLVNVRLRPCGQSSDRRHS